MELPEHVEIGIKNPINDVFNNLYLKFGKKFASDYWKSLSEHGYNSTKFEIIQVTEHKELVMFIPQPGKENTYSTYKQNGLNPIQTVEELEIFSKDAKFEDATNLLRRNITGNHRDIIVLFPYPHESESFGIYLIRRSDYENGQEAIIEGNKNLLEDTLR